MPALAPPASGWGCLDRIKADLNGWSAAVELWGNGQRIGVVARGTASAPHPTVIVRLHVDDRRYGPYFWHAREGLLADLGEMPTPAQWNGGLDAFRASQAEPALDVRVTAFDGDAWHVYEFSDGASMDGTVQATVRGRPGRGCRSLPPCRPRRGLSLSTRNPWVAGRRPPYPGFRLLPASCKPA